MLSILPWTPPLPAAFANDIIAAIASPSDTVEFNLKVAGVSLSLNISS